MPHTPVPWRRRMRLILFVLVLALGLSATAAVMASRTTSKAHAAPGAAILRDFLAKHRAEMLKKLKEQGKDLPATDIIGQYLDSQGVHCLLGTNNRIVDDLIGVTPFVGQLTNACWTDISPDPSYPQRRAYDIDRKKAVVATVNTGDPRAPLNVRTTPTPDLRKPPLRTLKHGDKITIYCQVRAQNVTLGPYAPTNVWDYIGDDATGMTQFVTDGSVYTGTNNLVAPVCPQSVAGYGVGKR